MKQPDVSWNPDEAALPPVPTPPRVVRVRGPARGAQVVTLGALEPPGSKYYTLRYVLNALLADGESVVRFPALSDDTAGLVRAVRAMGAGVTWERAGAAEDSGWALRVRGVAGRPQTPPDGVIQAGNAGAVLRLLLGVGALLPEIRFETDYPTSLGKRPNGDLLDALRALGMDVEAREPGGLLPITLRGGPPRGGEVTVSGARSSQYLSALLYLAPLLPDGLEITVRDELRSAALISATLRALAMAGIIVESSPDLRRFVVPGGQRFMAQEYGVPGDGPTAAALLAAAMTLGAPLRLTRLDESEADMRGLMAALDALGAPLSERPDTAKGASALAVAAKARLRGGTVDGDACIDSVPALVAAACFADGESRFERVGTLRLKESDRIGDLCAELARAGCDVVPEDDSITVRGQPEGIRGGVTVDAHDDHRLVQALAIVALRCAEGLTITGADAVAKSYPGFFADLARLGAEVMVMKE
ncbi:MAG: 3-phosphoshikimate 1-carboxyvinyltransferase [Ktedonobacterales bacterium]|nr:MAG: 3-phosphoshikimate 1-carboxyvinyltransferase [Ktedonobacterales bacterium]